MLLHAQELARKLPSNRSIASSQSCPSLRVVLADLPFHFMHCTVLCCLISNDVKQVAAEKAHKEMKQLAKERDDLAQSVQSMEARHRAAHKALSAAEHSTRQELQSKAEELQVPLFVPYSTQHSFFLGMRHNREFVQCCSAFEQYLVVDAARH